MIVVTDIFSQLRRDECKNGIPASKPYRDNSLRIGFEGRQGKLTIAVGRNLDDVGISDAESNYLLGNDVSKVTSAVRQRIQWSEKFLDTPRFGILQNMGFNLGIDGLLQFHNMLGFMQNDNFDAAALQMEQSAWYNEVGDRAKRLVEQMRTGEWK